MAGSNTGGVPLNEAMLNAKQHGNTTNSTGPGITPVAQTQGNAVKNASAQVG